MTAPAGSRAVGGGAVSPSVVVTALTHRGAVRPGNEDAVVVGRQFLADVSLDAPQVTTLPLSPHRPVAVAIADGLGGHAAGEVASGHAVRRLAELGDALDTPDVLEFTLRRISAEIAAMGDGNAALRDMGTTVVGLLVWPDRLLWFNVGDSRAFVFAGGYLAQLSVDDTPAATLAEPGVSPPASGVVTQVLGSGLGDPQPHYGVDLAADDRVYLLCSDGLSDVVPPPRIEAVLSEAAGDEDAVAALWGAAMAAGGPDNVTVVLVRRSSAGGDAA